MSAFPIIIMCKKCKGSPRYMEGGDVHPFCKSCRAAYFKKKGICLVQFSLTGKFSMLSDELCGKNPVKVENGRKYRHCSRTCAQKAGLLPGKPMPLIIMFYDAKDPYYEFTNFSPHPVKYKGRIYPTSEHLYQALKFLRGNPSVARWIRKAEKPRHAFKLARTYRKYIRPDWFYVRVKKMDLVLELKFSQNDELKKLLLGTGDARLVEKSPFDSFWGVGRDGKGLNMLGKALMNLRHKFQRNWRTISSSRRN